MHTGMVQRQKSTTATSQTVDDRRDGVVSPSMLNNWRRTLPYVTECGFDEVTTSHRKRNTNTQMATIVYASNVPMLIMSINCCKLNIIAMTAAIKPDNMVASNGVFVFGWIRFSVAKMMPSDDIAYKMRGNGNIAPNKLVHSAKTAPIDTIHLTSTHPIIL